MTAKEILDKYPKIFMEYHSDEYDMKNSCMVWGLEVPAHWLPVIDQLCNAMQNTGYGTFSKGEHITAPQVIAEQVKEKFNQLRFYYRLDFGDQEVSEETQSGYMHYYDGMVAMAESMISNLNEISYHQLRLPSTP